MASFPYHVNISYRSFLRVGDPRAREQKAGIHSQPISESTVIFSLHKESSHPILIQGEIMPSLPFERSLRNPLELDHGLTFLPKFKLYINIELK